MTLYKEQTAAVQGSEANSQQHLRFFVETIYGTAFFFFLSFPLLTSGQDVPIEFSLHYLVDK